jgi:HKD family nuclease
MIQYQLKLISEFKLKLQTCDEFWTAVAMISDFGLDFIQENINSGAKQTYLIGVGLPTSPTALTKLQSLESEFCQSKIHYDPDKFFHPKVYILKSGDKMTAYVGSGNCTRGGLETNLEVSVKIEDQQLCENLLKWLNTLFKFGKNINDEFLQTYSEIFERRKERIKQDQKELKSAFIDEEANLNLDEFDFTHQFFKAEHFKAFEGTKPYSHSDSVNQERMEVRRKLFKLHDKLTMPINKKRWNLHEHYEPEHVVSSAIHSSYTSDELTGMWLHYGRSKSEIKGYGDKETPLDYMRMQVIIHKNNVGIWNRVGKDNGSKIDRDHLQQKLKEPNFRNHFISVLRSLPDGFNMTVSGNSRKINEFQDDDELIKFVLTDNRRFYFIIGIDFAPDAPELSEENIINTVITNFEKLYPTYEIIKHNLKL